MSLYVNKEAPALVSPSEPTPSDNLPLSDVDHSPFLWHHVEVIIVFDHGTEPAEVMREALAKALVHYYPVAGRIAPDVDGGALGVACTGEGVWFVKASADCGLEDVDHLKQEPLLIPKEQLLPSPPQGIEELSIPFLMQVTQFSCGGFAVGFKFHHAIFDGKGVGQFIVAVSEMARGLERPTVAPVWCRDVIVSPNPKFPKRTKLPSSSSSDDVVRPSTGGTQPTDDDHDQTTKLVFRVVDIPLDRIEQQKLRFWKETGQKCTTFDVAVAKLWQSRARAVGLEPDAIVVCASPASIRHLHEELTSAGGGYYGNCLFPIVAITPSGQVVGSSLSDVIKLIRAAKGGLAGNYSRSLEALDGPPPPVPSYGDFALVDWRQLGFYEADFGWGVPNHVLPLSEHKGSSAVAGLINSPTPKKGVRVMAHLLTEEHYETFTHEMDNWS